METRKFHKNDKKNVARMSLKNEYFTKLQWKPLDQGWDGVLAWIMMREWVYCSSIG